MGNAIGELVDRGKVSKENALELDTSADNLDNGSDSFIDEKASSEIQADEQTVSSNSEEEASCAEEQVNKSSTQTNNLAPATSLNTSFPLSDSELPETFDSSFSADMPDFFADTRKVDTIADNEGLLPGVTIDVELTSEHETRGTSDEVILKHNEPSQIESTAMQILSSPASLNTFTTVSEISKSPKPEHETEVPAMVHSENTTHATIKEEDRKHNEPSQESIATNILSNPKPLNTFATATKSPEPGQELESQVQPIEVSSADEEKLPSVTYMQEELPRLVTTYADATNLAKKYPELAGQILTYPIPKITQPAPNPNIVKSLSSSPQHLDRPNWAAAPIETTITQPSQGTTDDDAAAYVSQKTQHRQLRTNGSGIDQSIWAPRRESRGSLHNPRGERHEPPPHQQGGDEYHQPTLNARLSERLSDPPNIWTNAYTGGNDTGTWSSQIQDWGRGTVDTTSSDAPSAISTFVHSDIGADRANPSYQWDPSSAHSWDNTNATNVPPDKTYRVVSPHSGRDRLGRHIITPQTIDAQSEQHMQATRQAFKQQVSDLRTTARNYLEGPDRGIRRALSSDSSNRGDEANGMVDASSPAPPIIKHRLVENTDETLEERFHQLAFSDTRRGVPSQNKRLRDDISTPGLRSDQTPFRDIQPRTINSPYAPKITLSPSSSSKLYTSSAVSPIHSQENQHTSNNFSNPADEWLPVQQSVDDWLPPKTPDPHRLAPFRALHPADNSGLYNSSKPFTNNHSNNHGTRNAEVTRPSGPHAHPNQSMARFEEVSSNNIGPGPETKQRYAWKSWQGLPAQTEAFSQYLAENYLSANYGGGRGRGWRGGRGTRSSAQYGPPRRNPYGPTTTEGDGAWRDSVATD